MAAVIRGRLRLPPKITPSEWADGNRILTPPTAQPGPWRTDRTPYLREIMDTVAMRDVQDVTVVKVSQSGGSEVLLNIAGYYIDQEPSSMLVIQPSEKPMAEAFSKERLAPMLRDTPCLRGKVRDPRSRDSGNTILHKEYPGGFLALIGANSPAGLASRPIRIVLADELDRWPASAGSEGDPLSLAGARQITYRHRRKTVKVSSPGNEGESRIEKEWKLSDQRHFEVPCPHCGEYQVLEWRDSEGKPDIKPGRGTYRLMWEKEVDPKTGQTIRHRPETAGYCCGKCGSIIEEKEKPRMLASGRWVKYNPSSRRAGFHISGLLSPWVRWSEIAAKWLAVMDDPEQRKTFFNTMLGLLYVEMGEETDPRKLESRREAYAAEVPRGAGVLTAGIDIQEDRLEVEIRGWGDGEESWQIRLERLYGDPEMNEVWERAEALLVKAWEHESGAHLYVRSAMVDSGYKQDVCFRFVQARQGRRVFAYKGVDNAKQPISRAIRANRDGVKVFNVHPSAFKDVLFARLRRKTPGPGYLHFGNEQQTGADAEYFQQFGAEKRQIEFIDNKPVVSYKLIRKRNEAIDLYVLNLSALRALGMHTSKRLGAIAESVQKEGEEIQKSVENPEPTGQPDPEKPDETPPPRRPGGWMGRMRGR